MLRKGKRSSVPCMAPIGKSSFTVLGYGLHRIMACEVILVTSEACPQLEVDRIIAFKVILVTSETCQQLEVDRIIAFKVILVTSETCPQLVVHAHTKFSV